MDDKVLEPLKYYESQGKHEHRENIENHLNQLIEKSGVDVEANKQTMEKWKKEDEEVKLLSKVIKKFKTYKTLLIIAVVLGVILTIASFSQFGAENTGGGVLLLIIGVIAIVIPIMVISKKVNPVIRDTEKVRQEHLDEMKKLENEGWAQMHNLNSLFTDEDSLRLIEKTLPDFSFEKKFSIEQERLLRDKYDFYDVQTDDCSMIDTLSGKYAGNPFMFGRRRVHRMGTHTYHGSLTITWTETYRDSQGKLQTRTRTQTLHASVVKPKPHYSINTFLLFGNQAAPKLSFSRESSHLENLSDKSLERKIKKGENKLQKLAKKETKNGGTFQEMANSEFDVLFGAIDRDNEVEFRLMYTPLGQRSTIALLKDSNNYGDDFDFIKRRRCNLIISDHAQNWKMHLYANDYKHFNFEEIKARFIGYNEKYFKSIFFDFAPIFCVPAYLEEPCEALEGHEEYNEYFTYYEHEVMANALDYRSFMHESSITEAILKTHNLSSENGKDLVAVTAFSYMGFDRIDFVPVKGGDGNYHNVPVPWIEYVPVSKTSHITVTDEKTPDEHTSVYYHTMGAGIIKNKN